MDVCSSGRTLSFLRFGNQTSLIYADSLGLCVVQHKHGLADLSAAESICNYDGRNLLQAYIDCESKNPDPCNFVAQRHKHCFNYNISVHVMHRSI